MLSPTTGYAALALALLARAGGGTVRVRYIADRCGIPGPYLSKIIHSLARAGLVGTRRGAGGGAWLTADPEQVTLLRLCELLDDPVLDRRCLLGLPGCRPSGTCAAPEFCPAQREHLMAFLRETTLARFADRALGPTPGVRPPPPHTAPRVIRIDPPSP